jgi:hypothetical protein
MLDLLANKWQALAIVSHWKATLCALECLRPNGLINSDHGVTEREQERPGLNEA